MVDRISVDIFACATCARCLVAWRRLKRAAALVETEVTLDLHWLPLGVVDKKAKVGAKESQELSGLLKSEGVGLAEGVLTRKVDALDAHRLLLLAQEQHKATDLQERLFHEHFEAGRDISDRDVLIEVAEHVGIRRYQAEAFLLSSAGNRTMIKALEQHARDLGVDGIPSFVLNEDITVNGLKSVDELVAALREAVQQAAAEEAFDL